MFIFLYNILYPIHFLINLWGGIFPSDIYNIGGQFFYHHFGYALTIIAFIFFSFIFLKANNIGDQISEFLSKKKFLLVLLILILIYLIILFFFYNDSFIENRSDSGGIIKKFL